MSDPTIPAPLRLIVQCDKTSKKVNGLEISAISELLVLECSKKRFAAQNPHDNPELKTLVNALFSAQSSYNTALL